MQFNFNIVCQELIYSWTITTFFPINLKVGVILYLLGIVQDGDGEHFLRRRVAVSQTKVTTLWSTQPFIRLYNVLTMSTAIKSRLLKIRKFLQHEVMQPETM